MRSRIPRIALIGTIVVVTVLEALAYFTGGVFEWMAAMIWVVMGLGFVALAVREIGSAAVEAFHERVWLVPIMVLLVAFATLWGIDGVESLMIQHEGSREVAAGLDAWSKPAFDYTGTGHILYPVRQYLVVAAPSLVLGRDFVPLRLGFSLVFIIGTLLFWAGATTAWRHLPEGRTMAALASVAVLTFPHVIKHLHWYEQTSLPLAFTLAACGWLLITIARPTATNLIGLLWIGAMLGVSYTPGLGSCCLLVVVIFWLGWGWFRDSNRGRAAVWFSVGASIVAFTLLSFVTRDDLMRGGGGPWRPDLVDGVTDAFVMIFVSSPTTFLAPVLVLPILAVIVLGLTGRLGLGGFSVTWWSMGIIAASIALAGYTVHPVEHEMHRAQVVIPPLLLLAGWWALQASQMCRTWRIARPLVVVVSLLVVIQAAWAVASSYRNYRPGYRELVVAELLDQLAERRGADEEVRILLQTGNGHIYSLSDSLWYFLPRHTIYRSVDDLPPGWQTESLVVIVDVGNQSIPIPEWVDRAAARTVSNRDVHRTEEMLVWIGRPAPTG